MKDVNDLMQAILEMDAAQRKVSEKAKLERTARLAALDEQKQKIIAECDAREKAACEVAAKAAEQGNADALAALGIVEHADVADAEAVVPTFRGTLDEACQLPVLKCAEGDRVFQPLAEENIVKALFCGCFKGRILYLKALPGSANVVIAVCLILGGEFFARVDFLVQLPDLHSISSANGTSRTETVREVIQY